MKGQVPSIGLVTPSLNQGAFLQETLESVLGQNYAPLEYVVVDGGSTDGSLDILKKYEKKLSGLVVEKDRGQSEAINKGLRRLKSDVVGWLCSDDRLRMGTLKKVGDYFRDHEECQWLIGGVRMMDAAGRELEERLPCGRLTLEGVLLRQGEKESGGGIESGGMSGGGVEIPQPGVFWRRQLLEQAGLLNEKLHYAMDFDLWLRFLAMGVRPHVIKQALADYRLHEASKSMSQKVGFLREHLVIEGRYLGALGWGARYRLWRRLGYQTRMLAVEEKGRHIWREVFKRPWWIGSQQVRAAMWGK